MRTTTAALVLAAALAVTGCSVSTEPAAGPAPLPSVSVAPLPSVATAPRPTPTAADPSDPAVAAPAEPSPDPTPTAAPDPTSDPTPDPSSTRSVDPTTPEPSAEPTPEPDDGQLRQGDSGPEVLAVQERLSALGYWLGAPDGSFGALTAQAVLAVQKAAGLSRDGVVGPRTLAALESGVRPDARGGGDRVEIDLDRQLLLVVRDGEVRTVLNTSTGVVGEFDTPPGRFTVQRAIDGLRVAPLGELWRPRYFNGGIAVHGSPSIPAYPASHGCARLSDAAIDMVWAEDLMPIGSPVDVY